MKNLYIALFIALSLVLTTTVSAEPLKAPTTKVKGATVTKGQKQLTHVGKVRSKALVTKVHTKKYVGVKAK